MNKKFYLSEAVFTQKRKDLDRIEIRLISNEVVSYSLLTKKEAKKLMEDLKKYLDE